MDKTRLIKPSIVIEGFDTCGKSTLVKALSERLGMNTYHPGGPAKDMQHAIECSEHQLNLAKVGTIMDRITPISRLCYQTGHALPLGVHEIVVLAGYLHQIKKHAQVIWCVRYSGKHTTDMKPYDTEEHLKDIQNRAEHINSMYSNIMPYIADVIYDFHEDSVDDIIGKLTWKNI